MSRLSEHPVVLIDGVCNLCQGLTKFLIRHDPKGVLHFASLQSKVAQDLLAAAPGVTEMSTIVFIKQGHYYFRSDAVLQIAAALGFPWNLLGVLRIVPRFIRDGLYQYVAKHRYRWFGKADTCLVPTPEIATRFLDEP